MKRKSREYPRNISQELDQFWQTYYKVLLDEQLELYLHSCSSWLLWTQCYKLHQHYKTEFFHTIFCKEPKHALRVRKLLTSTAVAYLHGVFLISSANVSWGCFSVRI
jgi:hypothetical protein